MAGPRALAFAPFFAGTGALASLARTVTWPNRILLAVLIAGALAFLPERQAMEPEDLSRVAAERDELRDKVAKLHAELEGLEAEVRAMHRPAGGDETELARIARGDLNLIRPGEVVFEIEHLDGVDGGTP